MSKSTISLLCILLFVVGAVISGLSIYFWQHSKINDLEKQLNNAVLKIQQLQGDNSATTDITVPITDRGTVIPDGATREGWQIYQPKNFGISFQFPSEWGQPTESQIEADNALNPVQKTVLDFEGYTREGFISITYTDYADYLLTDYSADAEILHSVYQNQSTADLKGGIMMPPENVGTVASTYPEYFESSNGIWRGMYYYAYLAQDDAQDSQTKRLNDLIVIVMDDEGNIIQMHKNIKRELESPNTEYITSDTCISADTKYDCVYDQELTLDLDTIHLVVDSLK